MKLIIVIAKEGQLTGALTGKSGEARTPKRAVYQQVRGSVGLNITAKVSFRIS
jgi:hypothetical protein